MRIPLYAQCLLWILFSLVCSALIFLVLLMIGLSVGFGSSIPHFEGKAEIVILFLVVGFFFGIFQAVRVVRKIYLHYQTLKKSLVK